MSLRDGSDGYGRRKMSILLMILVTLVAIEFGVHIIYQAVTGKAGLYDPAFDYLKDVWRWLRGDNV